MSDALKPRDEGGLPCPDCGSPLRPCRCHRQRKTVRRWGSTLRADPEKKLRTRTLAERFEDDPTRYGVLFDLVRRDACFGLTYLPGHVCGLGYAPPSAHHLGKTDLDGLLPVCGRLHDEAGEKPSDVERRLREAGRLPLQALGRLYVTAALRVLDAEGDLPADVATAARKAGYRW